MMDFAHPDGVLPIAAVASDGAMTVAYDSRMTTVRNRVALECHLFSFLRRGEKSVSYAGGTERIGPSHFMFLPAGNCLMSEKTADNGEYRSRLLFCGQGLFASFFEDHFRNIQAGETDGVNRRCVSVAYDKYLRSFVESLASLDHADEAVASQLLKVKLFELLLYLCNIYPDLIPYFKGFGQDLEEEGKLRRAVMANVESSVTIPELAFLCNMSLSTFKRKFARLYGVSPKQWFLQQKMERAAVMLKSERLRVSDIYVQLGYGNLSSFIQAFKQFYGTTPKQYQG